MWPRSRRGGGVGAPPGKKEFTPPPEGCTRGRAGRDRLPSPKAPCGLEAGEEVGLGPRRGKRNSPRHPKGAPVTAPVVIASPRRRPHVASKPARRWGWGPAGEKGIHPATRRVHQ